MSLNSNLDTLIGLPPALQSLVITGVLYIMSVLLCYVIIIEGIYSISAFTPLRSRKDNF